MGLCDYYFFKVWWFLELSVVVVGPGALKPSDRDGIKSRGPPLHSCHSRFIYFELTLLFLLSFSLNICTYCGVCNNNNNNNNNNAIRPTDRLHAQARKLVPALVVQLADRPL